MGPDFSLVTDAAVILFTSFIFVFVAGKAFERKQ
jgi:hypothetical protein